MEVRLKKSEAFKALNSLVAALVSATLVLMGGLIWLDNNRAVIVKFGGAPTIMDFKDGHRINGPCLQPPDVSASPNICLVFGNGDSDDNREEPLEMPHAFLETIYSATKEAALDQNHGLALSYLDFGQLKLPPGDEGLFLNLTGSIIENVYRAASSLEAAFLYA